MKNNSPRLLVVDNDEVFNFIIEAYCKSSTVDCQIEFKTRAQDALSHLHTLTVKDRPDVILLDLNMPVMDGFEFLEAYYKSNLNDKKTRIFMISSSVYEADQKRALRYPDVEGFVVKPISKQFIKELLNRFN
ncbi:MAG: response regulator [Bacteroidota bacterium]